MKKMIYALVAALLLTGCFHDFHEKENGMGTVTLALRWDDGADAGTSLHDITVVFEGAGASFSGHYPSLEEAAEGLQQLPEGEYDILVTANMSEADGFIVTGLPATKDAFDQSGIRVSLKDPASSPPQAWFGVIHASVKEGEITVVETTLQRLLPTLSVHLSNVPGGTNMTLTLSNIAKDVNLMARGGDGRYGVPGTETVGELSIPAISVNLMPTASGQDRCILTLDITSAAGIPLTAVCDAPRMEVGKDYTLELDYLTLQPYMYITSTTISPWSEGWTVSGEILNPQE